MNTTVDVSKLSIADLQAIMLARKGEGRGKGRKVELTENDKKVIRKYVRGLLTGDFVSAKYIARETGVEIAKVTRAIARVQPATNEKGKPNKLHSPLFVTYAETAAKEIAAELQAEAEEKAKAEAEAEAKGKGKGKK